MIPTLTTLLKTITGKAVIGLTVATMGVGAAAAAGADLPVPSSGRDADDGVAAVQELAEDDEESSEESTEESSEESTEESSEESSEESTDVSTDESAVHESSNQESNHGAVVSDFTRSTELTGCEKGQATAAVARGDVDPTTAVDLDAELAPYIAKCGVAEDESGADEEAADEAEASDEGGDVEWKQLRDDAKAAWHEAKDEFVAACGDDDETAGDDDAGDEPTPECRDMKAELKALHEAGKAEWKDARDDERADRKSERKADRTEAKAERTSSNGKKHDR